MIGFIDFGFLNELMLNEIVEPAGHAMEVPQGWLIVIVFMYPLEYFVNEQLNDIDWVTHISDPLVGG